MAQIAEIVGVSRATTYRPLRRSSYQQLIRADTMPRTAPSRWSHERAAAVLRSFGHAPIEPYPGMGELWLCECGGCGAQVEMRLANVRKGNQRGCRHCAPNARVSPEAAAAHMRAAGYRPNGLYPGAAKPWPSRCSCGREAAPRYNDVRRGQRGCIKCAGPGRGDPQAAEAEMLAQGLRPRIPYPGVDTPWPSLCLRCGREPSPSLSGIREGKGCMYCARVNPVTPAEAVAAMRAGGFEPLEPYSGNSKLPWRSRCVVCQQESRPSLATTRKGHRCRFCAPYGIDLTAPARVYVMRHPRHRAVKIGIAGRGIPYDRIGHHRRNGWEKTFYVLECPTGEQAARIEMAVKLSLRAEHGTNGYLGRTDMPQGGWTETFSESDVPAAELQRLVQIAAAEVLGREISRPAAE